MKRQRTRRMILFIAFLVFPITLNYYSPYLLIEGTLARTATFSLFLWTAWFISALVIGRVGCAYICPLGGAQMAADLVAPRPLRQLRYLNAVKYILAIVWVGAAVYLAISVGGYARVNLLYNTPYGISVENIGNLITYYLLIALALLPAVLMGRYGFCKYLCPFSVLGIAGSSLGRAFRLPQLRLSARPESCRKCGACSVECPMSLPVQDMVMARRMDNAECILCASCVDVCPASAISRGFKCGASSSALTKRSTEGQG